MKRLIPFNEFQNESHLNSSRAPLYHTTDIWHATEILTVDALKKPDIGNVPITSISFSRDEKFRYLDGPVTFKIDADKLQQNYSIKPYDYAKLMAGKSNPKRKDFEFEEIVKKDVKDLHKYLLEIQISPKVQSMKFAKPDKYETKESYRDFLEALIEYVAFSHKDVKIRWYDGEEVPVSFFEKELASMGELVEEGIYSNIFGNRMYVSKAADQDNYKVYYSSYMPGAGTGINLEGKLMAHLKQHGIKYSKVGKNALTMSKGELDKFKKSLFNIIR